MSIRSKKEAVVAELKQKLENIQGAVIVDYCGLTVAQDMKLRCKMRDAGVEYRVVKNTMLNLAANELGIEDFKQYLENTTAIAISATDPVAPARVLTDFAKDLKSKTFKIKAGLLEKKVIDAAGVKALASLPSREVLLSQVLATMQAPITGLVTVLQGNIRNFVQVVDAVRRQKEESA